MKLSRYAAPLLVFVAMLSMLGMRGLGHDHTAKKAERALAAAKAQAQQTTEPAPRGEAATPSCRLTIELLVDDATQPVAGLVRVTNLASGKAIAFADEIHRDKNWYAIAPRTTLTVPRAKLKVEAVHGLETELATREIDLTGKETRDAIRSG